MTSRNVHFRRGTASKIRRHRHSRRLDHERHSTEMMSPAKGASRKVRVAQELRSYGGLLLHRRRDIGVNADRKEFANFFEGPALNRDVEIDAHALPRAIMAGSVAPDPAGHDVSPNSALATGWIQISLEIAGLSNSGAHTSPNPGNRHAPAMRARHQRPSGACATLAPSCACTKRSGRIRIPACLAG